MGKVTVQLFGAFRTVGDGVELELDVGEGGPVTIGEVRRALVARLNASGGVPSEHEQLVASAAFGSEVAILGDADRVSAGSRIAVLPPVCGG